MPNSAIELCRSTLVFRDRTSAIISSPFLLSFCTKISSGMPDSLAGLSTLLEGRASPSISLIQSGSQAPSCELCMQFRCDKGEAPSYTGLVDFSGSSVGLMKLC